MTVKDRQKEIIESVNIRGYITIAEVVEKYDVSYETARRDFEFLQNNGFITRVFGGAVPVTNKYVEGSEDSFEDDYRSKDSELTEQMVERAAQEIKPGEVVFLGQGTTIRALSRHIKDKKNIIVVTNSLYVAEELSDSELTVFIVGGLIEHDNHGIIGDLCSETMEHFYCDKTFVSSIGIDKELGIMDFGGSYPNVQKYALERTKKKYLVVNSKKFGTIAPLCICKISDMDTIITDCNIPHDYKEFIEDQGVELIIAGEE